MAENSREKKNAEFERLQEIMRRLRAPGGCPWDREQTLESLRPYIIEEAYELVEAIEKREEKGIVEECGDLLLQVFFIAQIARETGAFDMGDILQGVSDKLERRHPHVFGEVRVDSSDEVSVNWERIKAEERAEKGTSSSGEEERKSMLGGIPRSMPSLLRSFEMQRRAAKVGFDWPKGDCTPVLEKVKEEMAEIQEVLARDPENSEELENEMGDLLFAVVNLGRHLGVNSELALQKGCMKFLRRFSAVEREVNEGSRSWESYSLEELDAFWEEAKKREGKTETIQ
ncbi:MAG TPA: nucleoside triphosphate pyrophosphohydrolase [Synergistaceae bacterium]|nr:nucleoside triphosphate pyrophosphohydrolase [Synergistaceae bacterium]